MPKILICLTYQDRSTPLWFNREIRKKVQVDILLYEETKDYIEKYLKSQNYDYMWAKLVFNI